MPKVGSYRVNKAESSFLRKALDRGGNFRCLRHGWPDFLMLEEEKSYAVEVKTTQDLVRKNQEEMFEALEKIGIPVYIWCPSKPDRLIPWRKWNTKSRVRAAMKAPSSWAGRKK